MNRLLDLIHTPEPERTRVLALELEGEVALYVSIDAACDVVVLHQGECEVAVPIDLWERYCCEVAGVIMRGRE